MVRKLWLIIEDPYLSCSVGCKHFARTICILSLWLICRYLGVLQVRRSLINTLCLTFALPTVLLDCSSLDRIFLMKSHYIGSIVALGCCTVEYKQPDMCVCVHSCSDWPTPTLLTSEAKKQNRMTTLTCLHLFCFPNLADVINERPWLTGYMYTSDTTGCWGI